MQTTKLYLNYPQRLVLPMLIIRVNVSHIPRLCDILTSWNIFVVNLGIKFVPQVLIQFFITINSPNNPCIFRLVNQTSTIKEKFND